MELHYFFSIQNGIEVDLVIHGLFILNLLRFFLTFSEFSSPSRQYKLDYGGLVLGPCQFPLPQLPQKTKFASKVVKK